MENDEMESEVQNIIKIMAKEKGYENYEICSIDTNRKGDGFLGKIFMITIKDKDNANRKFDMVLKMAFKNKIVRERAPIESSFKNEINFYSKFYPMLRKFMLEKYGENMLQKIIPKCFKTCSKFNEEMLVVENLKTQGFVCHDKYKPFDSAHFELIFKTYGQFHASSFALKDQQFEQFKQLSGQVINVYQEFFQPPRTVFKDFMTQLIKTLGEILIPGEDDVVIEKFQKYLQNPIDIFRESAANEGKYSVLLHGDSWSNNMLFKYKQNSSNPTEICLIDFQLIRIASPVCDLSYCLFSGGTKENLDKLDDYLKIYYDSFSATLRKLGSDPEELFPFSALKEEWKYYAKFGLFMGMMVLRMKATSADDIIDLQDLDADYKNQPYNEEMYNIRMKDLLRHLSDRDVL